MEERITLSDGCELYCRTDDYTDPWARPKVLLCVHGLGESAGVWRGWVPHLARDYRVVRFDVRGFGRSTPMPADYQWSMERICRDLIEVMDHIGERQVHLLGAKSGGTMTMKFTADHGDRVLTLSASGGAVKGTQTQAWIEHIESKGVRDWAAATMAARFGTMLPPEAIPWWVELTAKTPITTLQSYLRWVPTIDITEDVRRIRCPMLAIAPTDGKLRPVAETTGWVRSIPNVRLELIEGDGWHVGGAKPDPCARAVHAFLRAADGAH